MNLLNAHQLIDLEQRMMKRLNEKIEEIVSNLNRNDKLEEALELLGMSDLLQPEYDYRPYKNGKIYIVGQCDIKLNQLLGLIKDLGFDKKRFEFCLEYESVKKFNFKKLFWKPENTLVLVGSMPHKTSGTGDYSSAIAAIEQMEGSPNVLRCGTNNLKMTKSSIKEALQKAIENGLVTA